jgi:glucose-1-phosphate thymidylyltransferase
VVRNNRYKPVAQFILVNLVHSGVKHTVYVINETKHQLIGYFGSGQRFGCHISYVVQEARDEQGASPGLAHALDSAYHLTQGKTVFFGMADTIIQPRDIFAQLYRNAQPDDDVILGLFPTDTPSKFGMVRFAPDGIVEGIFDKPRQTDLVYMWGIIVWRKKFTEYLHRMVSRDQISDFAAIMNKALAAGMRFRAVPFAESSYLDLGTYEEIIKLDHNLREE